MEGIHQPGRLTRLLMAGYMILRYCLVSGISRLLSRSRREIQHIRLIPQRGESDTGTFEHGRGKICFSIPVEYCSVKLAASLISEMLESFDCVVMSKDNPVKISVTERKASKQMLTTEFFLNSAVTGPSLVSLFNAMVVRRLEDNGVYPFGTYNMYEVDLQQRAGQQSRRIPLICLPDAPRVPMRRVMAG